MQRSRQGIPAVTLSYTSILKSPSAARWSFCCRARPTASCRETMMVLDTKKPRGVRHQPFSVRTAKPWASYCTSSSSIGWNFWRNCRSK